MNPPRKNEKYINVKISEAASIAAKAVKENHKPDMELQEIYSVAIEEYVHAYYPHLEAEIETTIKRRQEARRGTEGDANA